MAMKEKGIESEITDAKPKKRKRTISRAKRNKGENISINKTTNRSTVSKSISEDVGRMVSAFKATSFFSKNPIENIESIFNEVLLDIKDGKADYELGSVQSLVQVSINTDVVEGSDLYNEYIKCN